MKDVSKFLEKIYVFLFHNCNQDKYDRTKVNENGRNIRRY